jgi:hypothetical protein
MTATWHRNSMGTSPCWWTLFELPRADELSVNGTVLLWTTVIACATGVIFGTFPSLRLLTPAIVERLRQNGATETDLHRGRGIVGVGTRGALVVVQVALSLVLLIGAALMLQTIARLARVDLGFPSTGLLTMRVPLPVTTYDTVEKRSRFFDDLVTRVSAIPGVRGATIVRALPTTGGLGTNFQIQSQRIPEPGHVGQMLQTVVPGYFEVVGQSLKQGRLFDSRDNTSGLRVTIVGIACGVAAAYGSTRLLESLLFEVSTTDAVTFVVVPAVFVLVALLASLIPASRAVRIDPVGALRT